MITSESYILEVDVTKLQEANQWHKGSKMGKWHNGTKNRNRGNGVIRCDNVQMAKRAQNRNQWQKEHGGTDRNG